MIVNRLSVVFINILGCLFGDVSMCESVGMSMVCNCVWYVGIFASVLNILVVFVFIKGFWMYFVYIFIIVGVSVFNYVVVVLELVLMSMSMVFKMRCRVFSSASTSKLFKFL